MAVYLDSLGHMLADTTEELEAMARQIGHKPQWLQKAGTVHEHYDITSQSRRRLALRYGAQPITLHETAAIIARRREEVATNGRSCGQ